MKSRRNFSYLILLLVLGLAAGAIFLGMTLQQQNISPDDSKASSIRDCETTTNINPLTGTTISTEYCSGMENDKVEIGFTNLTKSFTTGKLAVYCLKKLDPSNSPCKFISAVEVDAEAVPYLSLGNLTTRATASNIQVVTGDQIMIQLKFNGTWDNGNYGVGWVPPGANNTCGGSWDISPLLAKIRADGRSAIVQQCWEVPPSGSSDYTFSQAFVAITVDGELTTPIPTNTVAPTATIATTATLIPSARLTNTPNNTIAPTSTATSLPTNTPTRTPINTATPTFTPTATATRTPTTLPTNIPSNTPTNTPRPTLASKITKLPPTAIIDDKTDTLIGGIALILCGFGLIYYLRGKQEYS